MILFSLSLQFCFAVGFALLFLVLTVGNCGEFVYYLFFSDNTLDLNCLSEIRRIYEKFWGFSEIQYCFSLGICKKRTEGT